jgi:hypothetical protein
MLWKRQCQAFCFPQLYKNSLLRDWSIVQLSWSQSLHLWCNISDPQLVPISLAARESIHFNRRMLRGQKMQEVSSYLVINSMERSPFWKAGNFWAHEEVSRLLRHPAFHYRVHKSRSLNPIMSQMNPTYTSHSIASRSTIILFYHTHTSPRVSTLF